MYHAQERPECERVLNKMKESIESVTWETRFEVEPGSREGGHERVCRLEGGRTVLFCVKIINKNILCQNCFSTINFNVYFIFSFPTGSVKSEL